MTTLFVGAILNNHEVLEVSKRTPGTSNRKVKIRCVTCEAVSDIWSTALQKDQKKCRYCASAKHGSDLERIKPLAILHADHSLTVIWDNSDRPDEVALEPNESLLVARSSTSFSPYVAGEDLKHVEAPPPLLQTPARPRPPPDPHFPARLRVPFVFLPYYLGEASAFETEAQEFYDKHVTQKDPDIYSTLTAGTTHPWDEGNQQWAYLYFTDTHSVITQED